MILVLVTCGVAIASALIPVINIEIYLAALTTQVGPAQAVALSISAGIGQTLGKIVWYYGAARFMESRWIQKKFADPTWRARYDRWHTSMEGRPWWAATLVFASAFLGVPPLLIVAIVAGSLRVPMWVFAPSILIGRTLRFYFIFLGVGLLWS